MRGFFILEVLLSLAIACMSIAAVSLVTFELPRVVQDAQQEFTVLMEGRDTLGSAIWGTPLPSDPQPFPFAILKESHEDESLKWVHVDVLWKKGHTGNKDIRFTSLVNNTAGTDVACDPFVSGEWTHPLLSATYSLPVAATISNLTTTPRALIVTAGSTTLATDPTLYLFSLRGTNTPVLLGGFDNATSSRIGFSSVAAHGQYVYAGNGFGSASSATCGGISCAQLHVFSLPITGAPVRISTLKLSTSSPPFAQSSDSATAPALILTYYNQYVYMGLQKTGTGYEFNIIDVHDPSHPVWKSGYRVGRSVRGITVRDTTAYVSTDDPTRELILIDISDPSHPTVRANWDAPGSTAFGFGAASTIRDNGIRFGRTYSSNAEEFSLLSYDSSGSIRKVASSDSGTAKDPESVRALLTQDWLTYVLLTHRLEFWNTSSSTYMYSPLPYYPLPFNSTGVALACRNNQIFVARNTETGTGYIDVLQGS